MLTAAMGHAADIQIIINPASAAGRTGRKLQVILRALEAAFPGGCNLCVTRDAGHATAMAANAVSAGAGMIVAVGGDGTINEVVNGMLSASGGEIPATLLGIINCGSGGGFAMSLGLPAGLDAQVRLLTDRSTRLVDVGLLSAPSGTSSPSTRYFVNECQIGIGADVVRRNSGALKPAGGFLGYGAATIAALFRTPNAPLRVTVDGEKLDEGELLGLSIGNGHRTGGGMCLTPEADLADGMLDLLVIRGQSLFARLRSFPRIYRGTHPGSSEFRLQKFHALEVDGPQTIGVAADGELIGGLPCAIAMVPRALRVIAPPLFSGELP